MRKYLSGTIVSLLVIGGMVMAGAPQKALAATNDTSVVNSGDNSTVNSSSNQTSKVVVNNSNTADINQSVNASANTGGNDANRNIGGTSINTGSAGVSANLGAAANSNTTVIGGTGTVPTSSNTTDVVNTGNGLSANTSTNTSSSVRVNNSNDAVVNQSCGGEVLRGLDLIGGRLGGGCSANTGGNDANRNIGPTSVTTGNAGVTANFGTAVNENKTLVGGVAGVNPSVSNNTMVTNTGDNVDVNTSANSSSRVSVRNMNDAYISQFVDAMANSGRNDANRNIGGASINTGNAGVLANLAVRANSNLTGIGDSLDPLSHNLLDVVNTGNYLDTNANTNTSSATMVGNNQLYRGYQLTYNHSNSGRSDELRNVGYSTLTSGMSGVGTNMGVQANTNTTFIGGLWSMLAGLLGF